MATFEQEEAVKKELKDVLTGLTKINPKDLVRVDDLGKDFNFESGLQTFERTLKLFYALYESNLDNISHNILKNLLSQAKDAHSKLNAIQTFSPAQQQNPLNVRNELINQIRDAYDGYFSIVSPVIAYSIRKGTDFETLENKAQEIVSSMESVKNEQIKKQKQISLEMESVLQKVRQAAAEVGIAQHATYFKEEAQEHSTSAKRWLYTTVVAALLTVGWGVISFFIHPEGNNISKDIPTSQTIQSIGPSTSQIIQFTVGKIIILSALYYFLVWCARNYNAHRHNFVVNKHRQNCLGTFETFVKAAGNDQDTKNAVLIQGTQSIFSAQSSGYIHKEHEAESPNKFIEILRGAGQKP
ncbi:MAG: hypothetical protein HZA14_03920 [Nitrospirae bacterium]|nr:hypothetical protein [Nitrospirota bacterium]